MRVSTVAYLSIGTAVVLALTTVVWIGWLNRNLGSQRGSATSYSKETAAKRKEIEDAVLSAFGH